MAFGMMLYIRWHDANSDTPSATTSRQSQTLDAAVLCGYDGFNRRSGKHINRTEDIKNE